MTRLHLLPVEPSPRNEQLALTDRRGDLRIVRGRSGNVPAVVVRAGELPPFPMPVIERVKEERA